MTFFLFRVTGSYVQMIHLDRRYHPNLAIATLADHHHYSPKSISKQNFCRHQSFIFWHRQDIVLSISLSWLHCHLLAIVVDRQIQTISGLTLNVITTCVFVASLSWAVNGVATLSFLALLILARMFQIRGIFANAKSLLNTTTLGWKLINLIPTIQDLK